MKNTKVILIIIALIIVLGGVGYFLQSRNKNQGITSTTTGNKVEEQKGGGVFESIKDAMTKSMSLKCEYTSGTSKTVAYVKGTAIRIDGSLEGKSNTGAIIKDNKLWSWDIGKKEGIIMSLQANKDKQSGLNSEKIISELEKEKRFCQTTIVSDSMFNPPTDVKFQDLSQMMQKFNVSPTGE